MMTMAEFKKDIDRMVDIQNKMEAYSKNPLFDIMAEDDEEDDIE